MSNYECNLCNFVTKKQGNYNRHIKTNKHVEKVIKDTTLVKQEQYRVSVDSHTTPIRLPYDSKKEQIRCEYCDRSFTRCNNLGRHLKSCSRKQMQENKLAETITLLNSKLQQTEKESKQFQEENTYHKHLLNEAGGLVKKSVSALTYVVNNYGSAPMIELLDVDDLDDLEENNKKLVEDVISAYKHKTLDKYLGDSIIKLYKKENPKDQSIWSTDTTRLTYLIKELMVNDSSSWIIDKKGTKTKSYLIDPLLKHIKSLIISYQKNSTNLVTNAVEIEFILETSKNIIKIVNDIDDEVVSNNLLRYISTHLCFGDKLLKIK
jgi:hypothetical protein